MLIIFIHHKYMEMLEINKNFNYCQNLILCLTKTGSLKTWLFI